MQQVIRFSFIFFCQYFCKIINNHTNCSALLMSLCGTDRAWSFFCTTTGFFLPEKSMFCSKTETISLCAAILLSTMATYFPVSRGSSSLSIQLLPRRVAVAAGAACWAPSTQASGHAEGSVVTVSCPHAKKGFICISMVNSTTFLPNSLKTTLLASVLQWLLCVIKRGDLGGDPGAHRALTSTDTVPLLLPSCLHTEPWYSQHKM